VEDEALLRWALSDTLVRAGHEVIEAADASSALRAVGSRSTPIDVVLLDLRLPDSSDLSLLETIRRQSPSSSVVMMSAHGTAQTAAEAKALGAYDMLTKPFDVSGIEDLLLRAYQSRQH
jgi:DNA-binding NtrC family response regulator